MKVLIDYEINNLPQVKSKTQKALKDVDAGIGKSITTNVNKAGKSLDTSFHRVLNSFSSEFNDIVSGVSRMGTEYSKVSGGGGSGKVADAASSGADVSAMAGKGKGSIAMGAIAAIGVGIMSGITILKSINKGIDNMYNKLSQASVEFRSSKELMENMWNLALRPMGNMMSLLMRPYLMLSMQYLRPRLQEAQEILRESGGQLDEEGIAKMTEIFKGSSAGLGSIFHNMFEVIKPIAGEMAGFQQGMDVLYTNFLDGTKEYVDEIVDVFKEIATGELSRMPNELADMIYNNMLKDMSYIETLPENIAEQFLDYVMQNPKSLIGMPTDISTEFLRWAVSRADEMAMVPQPFIDYSVKWKEILSSTIIGFDKYYDEISSSQLLLAGVNNRLDDVGIGIDTVGTYISIAGIGTTGKVTSFGVELAKVGVGVLSKMLTFALNIGLGDTEVSNALSNVATNLNTAKTKIGDISTDFGTIASKIRDDYSDYFTDPYDQGNSNTGSDSSSGGGGNDVRWRDPVVTFPNDPEPEYGEWCDDTGCYSGILPSHANGVGFVSETGPAMLHRGEMVVNPMDTNRMVTGQGTQLVQKVNFYGDIKNDVDVESLARNLKRQTEFSMRRKSL